MVNVNDILILDCVLYSVVMVNKCWLGIWLRGVYELVFGMIICILLLSEIFNLWFK